MSNLKQIYHDARSAFNLGFCKNTVEVWFICKSPILILFFICGMIQFLFSIPLNWLACYFSTMSLQFFRSCQKRKQEKRNQLRKNFKHETLSLSLSRIKYYSVSPSSFFCWAGQVVLFPEDPECSTWPSTWVGLHVAPESRVCEFSNADKQETQYEWNQLTKHFKHEAVSLFRINKCTFTFISFPLRRRPCHKTTCWSIHLEKNK